MFCYILEHVPSTSGETKKLVAAYLHGAGLIPLSATRKAQLNGEKLQTSSRNMAMRAAVRADQRQMAAAPYTTASPHKPPR